MRWSRASEGASQADVLAKLPILVSGFWILVSLVQNPESRESRNRCS